MERTRKNDYLKYWRVVRKYIKERYGLSQVDLDILLFLYSEPYFTRDTFDEFDRVCPWDLQRFENLRQQGWIVVFRKNNHYSKALYDLSHKAKQLCALTYKLLNGEVGFNKDQGVSDMWSVKSSNYSSKVQRDIIEKINNQVKQKKIDPSETFD